MQGKETKTSETTHDKKEKKNLYRNSFEKLVNSYSLQESRKANPEKKILDYNFNNRKDTSLFIYYLLKNILGKLHTLFY